MDKEKIFYNRMLEMAKKSGKSFNQIERELGYTRNALHNYKYGGQPSASRLIEISEYFGISSEYLIGKIKSCGNCNIDVFFKCLSETQKIKLLELCQIWSSNQLKQYFNNSRY